MGRIDDPNSRKDIVYSEVDNSESLEPSPADTGEVPKVGYRHLQCFLYFMLIFTGYGTRVILSVAIVSMTNPEASSNPDIPTFPEWTRKGAVLSAFFWGYIWPQVFAGYAANKFGAKWFLIATMGVHSLLSLLVPVIAVNFGDIGLMVTRAAQGFCQGFFFPIVGHLLSQWVPREERARLSNYAFAAVPFGTVVALYITGDISASRFGWPMAFYLYGAQGILWCILFSFIGYNSPAVHPRISQAEKYYIENSLGHTDEKPSHEVPWKSILTSVPVWALVIAQCGGIFGFWILLSQIPTYMNYVMHFNIKDNSTLSSLPYLMTFVLGLLLGSLSDCIVNRGIMSQTKSRKLFNTLGCVLPAVALLLLAYTKSDETTKAVILLMIAVCTGNISMAVGWGINHMDLTPNHAGTLVGLCNGISNILAILAPLLVQIFIKDETDPAQWRLIFCIAAGFYIITTLIYDIFGSGEVQPWNNDENEVEDDK